MNRIERATAVDPRCLNLSTENRSDRILGAFYPTTVDIDRPTPRSTSTTRNETSVQATLPTQTGTKSSTVNQSSRLYWAQITKLNRAESAKILPKSLQDKIKRIRWLLVQNKVKRTYKHRLIVDYFKDIRHGSLVFV